MQAYDAELSAAESRGRLEELIAVVDRLAEERAEAHVVERQIFSKLLLIGLALMKQFFGRVGTGDVGKELLDCDGILRRQKGLQPRDYFSIFGKFEVPRSRYRSRLGTSRFPLDEQVNLPSRCYSYVLQGLSNKLVADLPFRESSNYLEEFFGIKLSESIFIDLAKDADRDYEAYYKDRLPPASTTEGKLLTVSFDGKGIPMIKKEAAKLKARLNKGEKRQKKKESLVGVCYTVDPNFRLAEDLAESLIDPEASRKRRQKAGDLKPPPKAQNIRRLASLERSKEEVFSAIRDDAKRRDPRLKRPLVILLDGALGLEKLARKQFIDWPTTYIVLDIIHVRDYLWDLANSLFGEKTQEGRDWVLSKLAEILKGRTGYVIGGLRQMLTKGSSSLTKSQKEELSRAITYFNNHRAMMRYDEYLQAGLPVATSIVESSCGTLVKHRMEGAGKRWGILGAEAILKLRSLKMSNNNDLLDFARFRAKREKERLYGEAA